MQLILNATQLNIILDIVLEFIVDCIILRNMKILLLYKAPLTIKKICSALDINPFEYFPFKKNFHVGYLQRKLCALRKDNQMMKLYLDNKEELTPLNPQLDLKLSHEFKDRNALEDQFKEISEKEGQQSEKENLNIIDENKELKKN